MSNLTHCDHGVPYKDAECWDCDRIWAAKVSLPLARETIGRLLRFYNVDTLRELVFAQDHHVEKLQAKLQPLGDEQPRKVREG